MSEDKVKNLFKSGQEDMETQWISISDIMTVLMIIFLFVSILYMKRIQQQVQKLRQVNEAVREINKEYIDYKEVIYDSLKREFKEDLKKWEAELQKDPIVIRFLSPDIMFHSGKSDIQPRFKKILHDFCPRYFSVLSRFQKIIEEIRIEGHTSFEWEGAATKTEAYFKNMKLSQGRTRSVLQYCVTIKNLKMGIKNWATKHLTANGLSSSKPLCSVDGDNCRIRNRRVEFRAQINREEVLDRINRNLSQIQQKDTSLQLEKNNDKN